MNIIHATSECVPYSKTGGLADVSGALPDEQARLGNTVTVFTPYYRSAKKKDPKAKMITGGTVPIGEDAMPWTLWQASGREGRSKVYFIGCDAYFDRAGLYGENGRDYEDNCQRFVFFSRACIAAARALGIKADIWHCHDWETALIPVYLKLQPGIEPRGREASIFTIHNMAYHGAFWHWDWPMLNLPWKHYNWKELEFYGKVNLLKSGLVFADLLTTVSPSYAAEIQTNSYFGFGLEGILRERANTLVGVVNGVDTTEWDPATDPLLPAHFSAADPVGKAACKKALRKKVGLPEGPEVVIGLISRLVDQKGLDLILNQLEGLLKFRLLQLVILGTGEAHYHRALEEFAKRFPNRLSVNFAFDNGLAHLIEAGSDMYLMPSRFEPCGLNQMYSLIYGTVPIVHNTGGLADTVTDTNAETVSSGTATGFKFYNYNADEMAAAIDRAIQCYFDRPAEWKQIMLTGMRQRDNLSWKRSAERYQELYRRVL